MSFNAQTNAIHLPINDPTAKLVLVVVGDHADKHGNAFPSVRRIAQMAGIAIRTVFRKLKILEALGLLSRKHRYRKDGGWRSNLYKLAAHLMVKPKPHKRVIPPRATVAQQEPIKKKPYSFASFKGKDQSVPSTKSRSMGMNSIGDILSKAMNRATA